MRSIVHVFENRGARAEFYVYTTMAMPDAMMAPNAAYIERPYEICPELRSTAPCEKAMP